MSEANDQPGSPGVEGPGNAAQTDDHDTELFDRVEAPEDTDGDADPPEGEGGDEGDQTDKPKPEDDDHVEVERAGQKFRVPKALHGELLMQADYTRKTSEHAEAVRKFDEERTTWESQREESRAALPEEHARVAVIQHNLAAVDKQLDELKNVDWETWRNQTSGLANDDPAKLKYERYRASYMAARDTRIDLSDQLDVASKDLSTKEADRLEKQRASDETELAKQRQETGRALAAEVPGWNAERAVQVAQFMANDLGIAPEEIGRLTDAKTWKFVDRLMKAEAKTAELETALKQTRKAVDHTKAQQTQPAEKTKGTGGQPRDPSTARGDDLTNEEWMRRRRAQVAKAR